MAKKEMKKSKKKAAPSLATRLQQVVKEFEGAVNLLNQKKYPAASAAFQAIITDHPQEKEIVDRCRVYRNLCESRQKEKGQAPTGAEELFYQGVMETNRQEYDLAIQHLEQAHKLEPASDRFVYVLATTLALKGERDLALTRLREAIDLNAVNRAYAQQDGDFDTLRDDETFLELVYPSPS